MSAASETRIFGIKLGIDPKIVVAALFAIALLLFFLHGRGDEGNSVAPGQNPALVPPIASVGGTSSPARQARRRARISASAVDRGTIRIRPVDATRGDVDPTLRTDMLERLRNVKQPTSTRSLFEIAESMPTSDAIQKVNQVIHPAPVVSQPVVQTPEAAAAPPVNIPLKFYGFVKSARNDAVGRGLFLDGDNVIIASEGDVIDGRYLIVTLTAQDARMEDTQLKQGQTLQVEPQSLQQ